MRADDQDHIGTYVQYHSAQNKNIHIYYLSEYYI